MRIEKIFVGGWFQRTTLHLSEMYDFLKYAESPLNLDTKKLRRFQKTLSLESVEMHMDSLEYIELATTSAISVKIFEDGLILLGKTAPGVAKDEIDSLTTFYEKKLSPALGYLFSLGAPVPKEIANIKTIYPYFIVLKNAKEKEVRTLLKSFDQEKYFEIRKPTFEIYRGDKLYIINSLSEKLEDIETFVCEQIFMREFKGQLHRYLNLHRIIWEKIDEVKERGDIKGADVGEFNTRVQSYAKTINLIEARMRQMGSYIHTREAILKKNTAMLPFRDVLQFKHETLANALSYVQDVWVMTKNYVDSTLAMFSAIQAKSTDASVKNLTVITSMGVGATLIGLFSQKAPQFTLFGAGYFVLLVAIGYFSDKIIKTIALRRKYKIKDVGTAKDI